jgi:glutamate racemase
MRIGVFDSGMGGLIILKSIVKKLPRYDYLYLGDTKNLPYGGRSEESIHRLTLDAVKYLLKNDCKLVIIACNTASAQALRKIQQQFLPKYYPDRKVLGIIKPTVEVAALDKRTYRIGVLATASTVRSKAFVRELKKLDKNFQVFQKAAPKLVPMIENNQLQDVDKFLREYISFLLRKNIQTLILGCTHYPILKKRIRKIIGNKIRILSQDEIIADKVQNYLWRHREVNRELSKHSKKVFQVTKINDHFVSEAKNWFGPSVKLTLVKLK